jgi:hypothetical protein
VSKEDLVRAFLGGFEDEAEKLGFDKEAFLPALAAGLLVGGASLGLGALAKPGNMSWRQWMPRGTAMKTLGHFGSLSTLMSPGAGGAMGLGLRGFGAQQVFGGAAQAPRPFPFRPPTISGLGYKSFTGNQAPGAF